MSEQDWTEDEGMPRDETLARFNALPEVELVNPEWVSEDGKIWVQAVGTSYFVGAPTLGGRAMRRIA